MKKLILSLITTVLISYAHSQTLPDSTTLPNYQLRIALQKIELGKQCATELQLQKDQNKILFQRIEVKDSIIFHYQTMAGALDSLIDNYKASETNMETQISIRDKGIKQLQRSLRIQRIKTKLTGGAGLIGIAALAYLLLK